MITKIIIENIDNYIQCQIYYNDCTSKIFTTTNVIDFKDSIINMILHGLNYYNKSVELKSSNNTSEYITLYYGLDNETNITSWFLSICNERIKLDNSKIIALLNFCNDDSITKLTIKV